jgi:predicted permease
MNQQRFTSLPQRLIALIGVIVPQRLRTRFRQEWEAELQHREARLRRWNRLDWRNRIELLRRSSGAFWDALLLQPRRLEDEVFQDLRFGLRMLLRQPGFTAVALLTLGLGIGANTAIFSVVNGVLLRPLPFQQPERLAMLWTDDLKRNLHEGATAYANVLDWRSQSQSFADMAIFSGNPLVLTEANEPERALGSFVSANLFPLLGVKPVAGRSFSPDEEASGERVVVLSHQLWQRRFGGAADAIGKSIKIDGDANARKSGPRTARIIGVMPPDFYFPNKETQLWEPATVYWRWQRESTDRFMSEARRWGVVGRLKPQVTLRQAQAEMNTIGQRLTQAYPTTNPNFPGFAVNVVSLLEQITGKKLQLALWVLLGAVVFVLLIACVNVANLMLARGATREREFAIRAALGASRGRLLRQLLTESVALAMGAGLLGLALAAAGVRGLLLVAPPGIPRLDEVSLDPSVLLFTLGISLCAGLFFGLAPAWKISQQRPQQALKENSTSSGGLGLRRTHSLLAVLECALAVVLLTGAGLLIRSFLHLQSVNPGFNPAGVLLARVSPPLSLHGNRGEAYFQQVRERIAAIPGVQAVASTDDFLIRGTPDEAITIEGRPPASEGETSQLNSADASPEFFQTLGVPLLRGRFFTRADALAKSQLLSVPRPQGPPSVSTTATGPTERPPAEAAIINETFARRFFPNEDPLGKRFYFGPPSKIYWYEIVGVVGDMHRQGLERQPIPEYFGPHLGGTADVIVRVNGAPSAFGAMVREAIRSVDQNALILNVTTAEARLGELSAERRLNTWLLALFAALALLLAVIGIYGVMHYSVAQRRHEIGVRLALGAQSADVLRLVIGQGLRLMLGGVALGLLAAFALTRVLAHLLFGVGAHDPLTFGGVALLLIGVAIIACYLPARRAAQVDPLVALRCE